MDKHIDLNVYKQNELLIENGQVYPDTQALPPCCPPADTKAASAKAASSCCGSADGAVDQKIAESVANVDFNEWVGKCCRLVIFFLASCVLITAKRHSIYMPSRHKSTTNY